MVGILKRNSTDKPTGMSGFIGEAGSESNFDSGVGVDSVGVDMYSPPDTPVSVEGDNSEQGSSEVEDQNATSLEKCHQVGCSGSLYSDAHTVGLPLHVIAHVYSTYIRTYVCVVQYYT